MKFLMLSVLRTAVQRRFVQRFASYGDSIQVRVESFGPLGATVRLEPGDERGLILQSELRLLRERRGSEAVVGETLPAFVQRVHDDGKLDVSLRHPNPANRITDAKTLVLAALKEYNGTLPIGDKSTPADIALVLPGITKTVFKSAVGTLYKERRVAPGPNETRLLPPRAVKKTERRPP